MPALSGLLHAWNERREKRGERATQGNALKATINSKHKPQRLHRTRPWSREVGIHCREKPRRA
jgi:hypothetical protein